MFSNFIKILKEKIALARYSILPALIFAAALITFLFKQEFSENTIMSMHISFYIFACTIAGILLHFNQTRPIFFILTIALGYFFINLIKKHFGADFANSIPYKNLSIIIPLNLTLFFFLPNATLMKKKNVLFLLLIFIQISLIETLNKLNISLDYRYMDIDFLSTRTIAFLVMNICLFVRCSIDGEINSAAMFFSGLSISLGFYYSHNPSALTSFFAASLLILLLSVAKNIYYTTYKDVLTGFDSRHSYIIHSKKLPLKYSIGIISIDNYDKLNTVFGKSGTNNITKMIANKIKELEAETPVYRYNDDELIIIFKNETKEYGFERLETIRKSIASSDFILNRRTKALKLTVSGSITEKKRSDGNAMEVLKRAKKALQNTNQFAQNFTSRA